MSNREKYRAARNVAPEALRILAAIATIEANGNSEPDVMAEALDGAISDAQAFWRLNHQLNISDWIGAVHE